MYLQYGTDEAVRHARGDNTKHQGNHSSVNTSQHPL